MNVVLAVLLIVSTVLAIFFLGVAWGWSVWGDAK